MIFVLEKDLRARAGYKAFLALIEMGVVKAALGVVVVVRALLARTLAPVSSVRLSTVLDANILSMKGTQQAQATQKGNRKVKKPGFQRLQADGMLWTAVDDNSVTRLCRGYELCRQRKEDQVPAAASGPAFDLCDRCSAHVRPSTHPSPPPRRRQRRSRNPERRT